MVNTKIRLFALFVVEDGQPLYSQQKQIQEMTVSQIMNSFLPNSENNKGRSKLHASGPCCYSEEPSHPGGS